MRISPLQMLDKKDPARKDWLKYDGDYWQWITVETARECLDEEGADLHARDKDERTPLHHAAMGGVSRHRSRIHDVVKFLLERGADGKAKDKHGKTPYDYAKENDLFNLSSALGVLRDAHYKYIPNDSD